uniref:Solute carrier family 25 member 10 n=1 Tax=Sinocyclocheilus anshuiensis TaxID=1608454 RepID=A0A671N704_9TELE
GEMAEKRMSRWYFGGIASCGAACCTHPLDLVKVHLQTQQEVKMRMVGMAMHVVKNDGVLALYNGLSASLCRQMSYSLTRFAIYETVRDMMGSGGQGPMPFYQKVLLGAFGGKNTHHYKGGCATFLCQPLDVIKTRLMNSKGEYRGVIHCLTETAKLGPLAFYKGLVPAGIRLIPHTVLTFVFLEQLRKYFGIRVVS